MGIFYNGANCDLYIGKAGKKLLLYIKKAKESVKIISPYLSPFLIKELLDIFVKGVGIQIITTDGVEGFYGNYEKTTTS